MTETNPKQKTRLPARTSSVVAALEDAARCLDGHGSAFAEEISLAINVALIQRAAMVEVLRLISGCVGDARDGWALGTYEMGRVREVLRLIGESA